MLALLLLHLRRDDVAVVLQHKPPLTLICGESHFQTGTVMNCG